MKDGIIELDTDFAKEIGFTSDKFDGWLWLDHGYVIISFIRSKRKMQGNLNKLFDTIFDKGFGIKVPTPTKAMKTILIRKGFDESFEYDRHGPVEVWIKHCETRTDIPNANIIKQRGQCYE